MQVRLDVDALYTSAAVAAAFSGAEELEVEVSQAMYDSCGIGVLRRFEGVRGVGRARVGGSVPDRRYARWLEERMMSGVGEVGEGEEFVGDEGWEVWMGDR